MAKQSFESKEGYKITYHVTAEEKRTYDHPGCPSELEDIQVNGIDIWMLDDGIAENIKDEIWEDVMERKTESDIEKAEQRRDARREGDY